MKIFPDLLFTYVIVMSLFAGVAKTESAALSLVDQSKTYITMIKEKKNGFICIIYSKAGNVEKITLEETLATNYPKDLKNFDDELAAEVKVVKQTGVQNGESKNLDTGEDKKSADRSNQIAVKQSTPQQNAQDDIKQKGARILATNSVSQAPSIQLPKPGVTQQKKDESALNPEEKSSANQKETETSIHSIMIECRIPDKDGKSKKISLGGNCKNNTLTLAYKPKELKEEKLSTQLLQGKDVDGFFVYTADMMDFSDKNHFGLATDKDACTLQISGAKLLEMVFYLFMITSLVN